MRRLDELKEFFPIAKTLPIKVSDVEDHLHRIEEMIRKHYISYQ
jgi:hypothetical protein